MPARRLLTLILALPACLPAQERPPAAVSVVPVVQKAFAPSIEVLGQAEAYRMARASAEIDGLVDSVLADAGQPIDAEKPLVKLETALLDIRLRKAQGDLTLAEQSLAELEAGTRPEELRRLEKAVSEGQAKVREADARLREAQRELKRVEELKGGGSVSEQEHSAALASKESMAAAKESAQALLEQRQAALDLARAGTRKEVIAQARAQVQVRTAERDEAQEELDDAEILAPLKGVVLERLVEKGHYVRAGDAVMTLVCIDPIRIVLSVPEEAVDTLLRDRPIKLRLDALPGESLEATFESVVPEGDPLARTFPLRATIPNPEGRILPGMMARARLPLRSGPPSLAVPRSALVRMPSGFLVFAVREGCATPVPVTTGAEQDGVVAVEGALVKGEDVVVRGNERLRRGQPVRKVPLPGRTPEDGQPR